jgi:hypothetical protein
MEQGNMKHNALTAIAAADVIIDGQADAPRNYAEALTQMVADGWADRLPMDVKGRPSGDVAAAKSEVQAAYKAAGVTGAPALRQRVLRLTYALHILAANGRREDEADDAYVTRVGRIRNMANAGDRAQIDKALAGSDAKAKRRGTKGPKAGRKGGKGGKTDTPEVPEVPMSPADRWTAAVAALIPALIEARDAAEACNAEGVRRTKASQQQVKHRVTEVLAALAV